jgi:hypothetical protein
MNCPLRAEGSSLECVIMKNFAVSLVVLLLAVARVSAQVTVSVSFESEQFLANEPLIAKVRIVNDSGATLHLGEDTDWLNFAVETLEGPYVQSLNPPDVVGAFDLESSHTATKRVDLAPCFNLTRPGKYKVVATVKVPAFNTKFASPGKAFYITTGTLLWQKEFGVPLSIAPREKDSLPETRKYIILQSNSGKESKLYVRVTDRLENNIRVIPIGTLISFSHPEPQLDKWSNLHLLYQTAGKTFSYSAINPEGQLMARETHEYSDTRPILSSTDEGRVVVRGGNRRLSIDDIPPFDAADLPEPIVARSPAATNSANSKKATSKKSSSSVNAKEKTN